MPSKKDHEAARAKAKKEKKVLLGLAPLFLVAVFFAYHTLTKINRSSEPTPTSAAVAVPAANPRSATTPSAGGTAPATTTPATATPATGMPIAITIPAGGKLTRLGLFSVKDPFHDQGPRLTSSSSSPDAAKKSKDKAKAHAKPKKGPAAPPTAAVIAVNGHLMSVPVGAVFPTTKDPATNGVFRLVGLTARSAKVAVAGGSYANGSHTLTLTVNSVVTLVNTADGKRYTLVLYPPKTTVPGTPTTTSTGP
jgi:hypothetical protein